MLQWMSDSSEIDLTAKEKYLSDEEEFLIRVFNLTRTEWEALPKWKRIHAKNDAMIF